MVKLEANATQKDASKALLASFYQQTETHAQFDMLHKLKRN